jgi:hypothetical protein
LPASKTFAHVPTAPFNGGTLVSHGVASATVASVSVPEVCAPTNKKFPKLFSFVVALGLLCGKLLDKNTANNAHTKSVRSARPPRFSLLKLSLDEEEVLVTLFLIVVIIFLTSLQRNKGGLNTTTKGLPSPSRVCKRSLCTKEDLTDNEHTRGREKDFPNDFSARKSSLFSGRIYIESVNDKTRALMMHSRRCALFWRSIPFRYRPTFWFFASGRFFLLKP